MPLPDEPLLFSCGPWIFNATFNDIGTGDSRQMDMDGWAHGIMDNIQFTSNLCLSSLYNRGNATLESIQDVIDNVGAQFSNHIRAAGLLALEQPNANIAFSDPAELALGVVRQTAICIQFDWFWLLFQLLSSSLPVYSCLWRC